MHRRRLMYNTGGIRSVPSSGRDPAQEVFELANRILKDSIRTSPEIDALSWFEEVLFYRLIVSADDYGVFPADPVMLSHLLFPRKENISRKAVEAALDQLEKTGLIRRYRVGGKGVYLHLVSWDSHQRLRTTQRKYPAPEEAGSPPEPAASDPCPVPDEPEPPAAAAPEKAEPDGSPEPPVITIPLNDGSEYPVLQRDADEYASLYPAVDVLQELRSMRGWSLNNETKRKTRSGIRRFINSWMARAQDAGGMKYPPPARPAAHENPYQAMICEGEVQ